MTIFINAIVAAFWPKSFCRRGWHREEYSAYTSHYFCHACGRQRKTP